MNSPAPSRVAAFFDLDGTLIPFPSLERRLVRALVYRHAIPVSSFALWPLEWARLAARGVSQARQGNKVYLRKVPAERAAGLAEQLTDAAHLAFFPQALDCVAWHASQGHAIALVTGTLELLARSAAWSLQSELALRGFPTTIFVRATSLEEDSGRWTGRTVGEPMFGLAKAAAAKGLAASLELNLSLCYAYGDSIHDCHMLESVGRPLAVNPSPSLQRLSRRNGWPTSEWRLAGREESGSVTNRIHLAKRKVETLG